MANYNCNRCGKEFIEKSQYKSHNRENPLCEKKNIDELLDKEIEEKLKKLELDELNLIKKNKSPLRYPGGKTRACKKLDIILKEHFDINKFQNLVSPFFGGGSFEFYMQNNYKLNIIANDKFVPLYNFWTTCKLDSNNFSRELTKHLDRIDKQEFMNLREKIMNETDVFNQSIMYFIINRCSFSGATLSGGFSLESSKKRFTKSSIDNIKNIDLTSFTIYNLDFEEFITTNEDKENLMFLDPPYYLEKSSKLYGNNGDMHDKFDHNKLYECLLLKRNWLMTYNNCTYIKNLYKNYKIIETNWSYGMNKSKESSEIVIIG